MAQPLTFEEYLKSKGKALPSQPKTVAPKAAPPVDDSSDDDSDEEGNTPAPAPAASQPTTAPIQPPPQPSIRDYIAQRLGDSSQQLQALQAQKNDNMRMAGLAEGLGQMVAGISRSQDTYDPNSYKFLQTNAQQPTQDYLQHRAAQNEALKQVGEEQGIQQKDALTNPNSVRSQVARSIAKQFGLKADPNMSAADLSELEKFWATGENAKMRRAMFAQSQLTGDQKALNTDKQYTDGIAKQSEATKLGENLDLATKNPAAASMVPIEMVRTLVNRVNPQELKAASGGQDPLDVAKRISNRLTNGTLDSADYTQMKQWQQMLLGRAQSDIDSAYKRHAAQRSQKTGAPLQQSLSELGYQPPATTAPSAKPPPFGPIVRQNGHTYQWNPQTSQYE